MCQLAKLPILFEHYQAHHAANKNITVTGFLYEHYVNSSTSDPDYAADMQLPFKSGDTQIALNIGSLQFEVQQQQELIISPASESSEAGYPSYKQPLVTPAYLATIWQPPKS